MADTANGMGGLVVPAVFAGLPFELEILYGELDGTFPNHPADPIQPENLRDLQARVLETGADVGLAFDGDADRVFLVDDQGELVSGSLTTAIVRRGDAGQEPGRARSSTTSSAPRPCPRSIREHGGDADPHPGGPLASSSRSWPRPAPRSAASTRATTTSATTTGPTPGSSPPSSCSSSCRRAGVPLSELRKPFERYAASGEINTEVADPRAVIELVAGAVRRRRRQDRLDGLTVDLGDWWFNLRPSNTEPLLRLNLEAPTRAAVRRPRRRGPRRHGLRPSP